MKNEVTFKKYLMILCEIHGRTLSKLIIDLYWKILGPFDDEECGRAFDELIRTSRYFPKPADLLELLQGAKKDRATEAWLDVITAIARIGNYQSVKFPDPVIHSVIHAMAGGWPELCEMEAAEAKWKQREFERLYEIIAARGGKHPGYLPGTCELENCRTGYGEEQEAVEVARVITWRASKKTIQQNERGRGEESGEGEGVVARVEALVAGQRRRYAIPLVDEIKEANR